MWVWNSERESEWGCRLYDSCRIWNTHKCKVHTCCLIKAFTQYTYVWLDLQNTAVIWNPICQSLYFSLTHTHTHSELLWMKLILLLSLNSNSSAPKYSRRKHEVLRTGHCNYYGDQVQSHSQKNWAGLKFLTLWYSLCSFTLELLLWILRTRGSNWTTIECSEWQGKAESEWIKKVYKWSEYKELLYIYMRGFYY